jgi:hypothetical protein
MLSSASAVVSRVLVVEQLAASSAMAASIATEKVLIGRMARQEPTIKKPRTKRGVFKSELTG